MKIVVRYDPQKMEKITVKELSYSIHSTNKLVDRFEIINDNLSNCAAHTKVLCPEEMIAIYEYMKNIAEGVDK